MTGDAPFRPLLAVGLLAMLAFGLYYRIKSQASGEPLDRRQEGWFMLATLRPVGFVLWAAVIAYLINPAWMSWSSAPLPSWLRWTGLGVFAAAAALLTWTLRGIGANLTDTVVTRRAHTLVTRGPYRWVRHPFYDAMALLILSIALTAANWFFLIAGAIVLSLIVIRTTREEEMLVARFGDAYRTYMTSTGRFLPRRTQRS
jgi:protein-S-isoprenylcysteine O-methyltransferase Ste14